jgi:Na+/H+ antiporter NhaC
MSDADGTSDGLFPISDRRIEQGFLLVLLAWVSILLYDTRNLSSDGRLMPLLVGIPTLTLILLMLVPVNWSQVVGRFLSQESGSEKTQRLSDRMSSESGNSPAEEQRVALTLIGWAIALVILIRVFGFYYTLPPYTFVLTWYLNRDVRKALLVTVVFVAAVWFLFIYLFEQLLYRGMLDLPLPVFL